MLQKKLIASEHNKLIISFEYNFNFYFINVKQFQWIIYGWYDIYIGDDDFRTGCFFNIRIKTSEVS